MEIRTDLAIEAGEMLGKDRLPEGVRLETKDFSNTEITATVSLLNFYNHDQSKKIVSTDRKKTSYS